MSTSPSLGRVTARSSAVLAVRDLQAGLSRTASLQTQLSSGRRISTWADDPAAATAAQRLRSQEADLASFAKSASDATSWLDATDSTLQTASSVLARVQELAVAAGGGALGTSSRDAIADEIDQLRDALVDVANGNHLGRPMFGGFTPSPLARDASGAWVWSGDGGEQQRQVAPGVVLPVNTDGTGVFGFDGAAGSDLFSALDALAAATRSGDAAALSAAQTQVVERADGLRSTLGSVGALSARVDRVQAQASVDAVTLAADRMRLESVDVASTVVELQQAENAYTAALGAISRTLQMPTLADLLR